VEEVHQLLTAVILQDLELQQRVEAAVHQEKAQVLAQVQVAQVVVVMVVQARVREVVLQGKDLEAQMDLI
jgi:hypothetical protein